MNKVFVFWLLAGLLFLAACAANPVTAPSPPATAPATATPRPTFTPAPATPTRVPQTATPAAPSATPPPPIATTKLVVNVRSGPDVSYPQIGKLKKGEQRAILGKTPDSKWWEIDYNGRMGWIPADYTDVLGGTNLVALVSAGPLATDTPADSPTPASRVLSPTPTPTLQIPEPSGRIYFVIQQSAKWLSPTARDQIFPGVALGTPGDFNPNLSTNASPLDWSANANRLAFVFNSGSQDQLETTDPNSNVTTLAAHGAIVTPRWFGDGSQLAFVGYDNNLGSQSIYIVSARDGHVIQNCPARSGEQLRGLAVNRRTGDLAFVSNYGGRFQIWKMSHTCSGLIQLTFDDADASAPAFSPDGTRLAYVANKNSPTDYRIYVMPASGGDGVQLGPPSSFAPAFSPDGNWITFWRNLSVYIMDITGDNIQALTPGERPTWAP